LGQSFVDQHLIDLDSLWIIIGHCVNKPEG
jgi:hypothetical protein